jgi:hypothetical protein
MNVFLKKIFIELISHDISKIQLYKRILQFQHQINL